jgi:hypothetical protein
MKEKTPPPDEAVSLPFEPTLKMLIAGKSSLFSCAEDPTFDDVRKVYAAVIAAWMQERRSSVEGTDTDAAA